MVAAAVRGWPDDIAFRILTGMLVTNQLGDYKDFVARHPEVERRRRG